MKYLIIVIILIFNFTNTAYAGDKNHAVDIDKGVIEKLSALDKTIRSSTLFFFDYIKILNLALSARESLLEKGHSGRLDSGVGVAYEKDKFSEIDSILRSKTFKTLDRQCAQYVSKAVQYDKKIISLADSLDPIKAKSAGDFSKIASENYLAATPCILNQFSKISGGVFTSLENETAKNLISVRMNSINQSCKKIGALFGAEWSIFYIWRFLPLTTEDKLRMKYCEAGLKNAIR